MGTLSDSAGATFFAIIIRYYSLSHYDACTHSLGLCILAKEFKFLFLCNAQLVIMYFEMSNI